jgi:hypothetical protein
MIDNYDLNYQCKYNDKFEINKFTHLLKTKNTDINLDVDVVNELYRLDLLHIFKIDTYDDNIITSTIDIIYNKFIENNQNSQVEKFKKIIMKASSLFMSNNIQFGFMILFSFEYLEKTHKCLYDLINTKTIEETSLKELEILF